MKTMQLVLVSFMVVSVAAGCGKKEDAKGACIVDFDDLGGKGTACTVDTESRCKTGDLPPVRPGGMGSVKMKSFEAGKTCGQVNYLDGGCADVAIAWTFNGKCPQ
jgi:hypothetical protein